MITRYTVKQLSALAGVTVRALHHYDEIGLLRPTQVGANGYRYYDDAALYRLQQILLYREVGLELAQIMALLDQPDFDVVEALRQHRDALLDRVDHVHDLIATVDETLAHLTEGAPMSRKKLFKPFSEAKQKQYEREIRLEHGPDNVNESVRRWGSYTSVEKDAILEEGNAIYSAIVDALEAGTPHNSGEVQALMARWHDHLRYFYEPTPDILRGLGELYNTHPDFQKNFAAMHTHLAEYMREAIDWYVDALETAEIARMLEDDRQSRLGNR